MAEYHEGIYVGYRYYATAGVRPRFPFGYGLSYTTFAISDVVLDQNEMDKNGRIAAKVTVKNTGDFACFVRVKALAGEKYQDGLQYSDSDGKWTPGEEGYYYYSEPVAPGESSSVLDIKIDSKDTEDSFNVVVVQESTKVLYNEKNEPYADWTQIADTSETAGE